jgi:hypothetical protein
MEPQKVGCASCRRLGFKEVGHWVGGLAGLSRIGVGQEEGARGTRYAP